MSNAVKNNNTGVIEVPKNSAERMLEKPMEYTPFLSKDPIELTVNIVLKMLLRDHEVW